MIHAITLILTLLALLGIGATIAPFIQACACTARLNRALPRAVHRPTAAVLIPAHDEEEGIETVLEEIQRQLRDGDRLVVIADNCADGTAARAARRGAEVVVRDDANRQGKGFALAAGLEYLAAAPPEVVVFIDADGRLSPDGVEALSRTCAALNAPIQCRYLMLAGPSASARLRLAEFVWRIKNELRPHGYARLGLPCQLMGSGMALPWRLIDPTVFATGHVTEDVRIGLDYATQGFSPRFLHEVTVVSQFPQKRSGQKGQKKRWMHGHLALMASHAPRLIWLALCRADVGLLAMSADLLTPPLTLLVMFNALALALATVLDALSGGALPLLLALCANGLLGLSLLIAWGLYGRDIVGLNELMLAPRHMLDAVRIGVSFVKGDRSAWVRAERTKSN